MNNIVATSVQPDVAVRLIEAFADAATVQNSEDAMVMDGNPSENVRDEIITQYLLANDNSTEKDETPETTGGVYKRKEGDMIDRRNIDRGLGSDPLTNKLGAQQVAVKK